MIYSYQKAARIFSPPDGEAISIETLRALVKSKSIPRREKLSVDGRRQNAWSSRTIGQVGQGVGFLKRPTHPLVVTVFVTKGGVLKTSLCLNMARLAALHGLKTCVIGLDLQGDITSALGFDNGLRPEMSFDEALSRLGQIQGLPSLLDGIKPDSLLQTTDLMDLCLIPETPELVQLDQSLIQMRRREHWFSREVIQPLIEKFDLLLIDAPPNWNQLITGALAASDLVISPLECRINNFRNFQMFDGFMKDFARDLELQFKHLYVPTRHQKNRKLSEEIFQWYQRNLPNCTKIGVPEMNPGEEATALNLSAVEFDPLSPYGTLVKRLFLEIWETLLTVAEEKRSRELRQTNLHLGGTNGHISI